MKLLVIHRSEEVFELMKEFCENSTEQCFRELELDYVKDTAPLRFGAIVEYCMKMEKEGPEWLEPDPLVLEKVADADIILTEHGGINKKVIDSAKNLKMIATLRSAAENINVKYAKEKGICVSVSPSRLGAAVADMTVAMILSECRGLLRRNLRYNNGEWVEEKYDDASHCVLSNLKIGLVGYGGIARIVAKRLIHGFDCEVCAYENITPPEVLEADGVKKVSLEELCKTCDVISLHARLVPENTGMFGYEQFAMMKPNAILINTARAALVDEDAMIDALQTGKIRGAALDVYHHEPLPKDYPLLKMDNVTMMPHSAGMTGDVYKNTIKIITKDIAKFLKGEELGFNL
ncbi:MAG: hydroxyacid dehydrogenase [Ruminococcaceae bacterium]|nr:hydroxyacid dehydrogenase [Oscillospiraceae bacterium]